MNTTCYVNLLTWPSTGISMEILKRKKTVLIGNISDHETRYERFREIISNHYAELSATATNVEMTQDEFVDVFMLDSFLLGRINEYLRLDRYDERGFLDLPVQTPIRRTFLLQKFGHLTWESVHHIGSFSDHETPEEYAQVLDDRLAILPLIAGVSVSGEDDLCYESISEVASIFPEDPEWDDNIQLLRAIKKGEAIWDETFTLVVPLNGVLNSNLLPNSNERK